MMHTCLQSLSLRDVAVSEDEVDSAADEEEAHGGVLTNG